jgi:hypothetical protein
MPTWELSCLGYIFYFAGKYDQAIEALEISGESSRETKVYKALAYGQLGRATDAAREVLAVLKEAPNFTARGWMANDIFKPGASAEALFLDGARKAGLPIE